MSLSHRRDRAAEATEPAPFVAEVLAGLRRRQKRLPCKYFYDERGSALFDQICELDEYYLTRTELGILERHAPAMGRQIGPGAMLVEYGSGSSVKTRLLLDALPDPVAYVPVDISREHLLASAARLADEYPAIEILPVAADFTKPFALPVPNRPATHAAVFFPGSTIGNFTPRAAQRLLRQIAQLCGLGGGALIGIDLKKDPAVIHAAYNDRQGVTAEFNLNLLHRLQNELDAQFDRDAFEHVATYDERRGRVDMHLRSIRRQAIVVAGERFELAAGELIHTEHSRKYTIDDFACLAARAGLTLRRTWTDPLRHFALLHFAVL